MCFSASASFVAAGFLSSVGLWSLSKASPQQRMFALIPVGFALQQAAEGVLWLTMNNPSLPFHIIALYLFLTFALIIWPFWIPLSLRCMETNPRIKKLLTVLVICGLFYALGVLYILLTHTVSAQLYNCSIMYVFNFGPSTTNAYLLSYLIPTIIPFFISSLRNAKMMGILLFLALVVTYITMLWVLVSVWCFFAAILSVCIAVTIVQNGKYHPIRPQSLKA